MGRKKGQTLPGSVQRLGGRLGSVGKGLALGWTQRGSVRVLRCQLRSIR